MSDLTANNSREDSNPARLPLILLLFIGSGCAALVYEVVWLQLLQLIVGSSAVSLGVLLGTFMGGMCLGSLLFPRLISAQHHPLKVYAFLELGIGVIGLVLIVLLPRLDALYAAIALQGQAGILMRAVIASMCLLPPTVLMGATLPAIGRWVEATPRGIAWLGFFYGGNIAGAVLGCLLAGFYLLRVFDMPVATYVAVALNAAVALIAWWLSALCPHAPSPQASASRPGLPPPSLQANRSSRRPWSIYLAIGLSGFGALGAEVIWTRLLSLLIGGTVYTFSIILAAFLAGLGIGSTLGSLVGRDARSPRIALAVCQMLLAAAIAWAAFQLTSSLPYWPIDPSLAKNPWQNFQLDVVRCLWAIFPAAILWGASFPLALAAAQHDSISLGANQAGPEHDTAELVGHVYAANTVGAILGALVFSIVLVGTIGTQHAQQMLIGVAAAAAAVALLPLIMPARGEPVRGGAAEGALLTAAILGCGWLAYIVPPTPSDLIAHGRRIVSRAGKYNVVYQGEGACSSVAVTTIEGVRNFHVSGKIEASSEPQDMRLQRMLGHIPALVHPAPKSVLVVGCGAGVTAGSFLVHPSVERVVICEIEPLIPQVVAKHFAQENYGVVTHPKVQVVYDDARHFILTTREKFDVITSDPINPWVKGAATLYTREYFELCRSRLNEGGVITQWVPLYESNVAAVKSELATFFDVFPEGTIWSNDVDGQGYDVVLLGQVRPLVIDVDRLQERLGQRDHFPFNESLYQVGFQSGVELLGTYAGSASDLRAWLSDATINRDRNLRLQYLAGFSAHDYREAAIFNEMLQHRRYPEKLFVASAANLRELQRRMGMKVTGD